MFAYFPLIVIKILAKTPPRAAYALMRWLAIALRWVNVKISRITRLNLTVAFPHYHRQQLDELTQSSLHHSLYGVFEIARAWCNEAAVSQKNILSVEGQDILQDLLVRQQPIILVCPHLGNWEIVGHWLNSIGYEMSILYKPLTNKYVNELMIATRTQGGNNIFPVDNRGVRQLYRDLKSNKIVGILPDQVPHESSGYEMSRFFSADAATMTLIYMLTKKTNAVPVFITALREQYKGFHIHIQSGERMVNESMKVSVRELNKGIEQMISLAPEQYQWSYRRYRHSPMVDYNLEKITLERYKEGR